MFLSIFQDVDNPVDSQDFVDTIRFLRNDAVLIYPTDTGYSMGCDLHSDRATDRVTQVQSRQPNKPYTLMCSDIDMVRKYAIVDKFAEFYLKQHLPGPYTFILKAGDKVPKIAGTKRNFVGVRIPELDITRHLIHGLGNPLLSSTVRMDHGPVDPLSIARVYHGRIDGIVDGGTIAPSFTSVIDLSGASVKVIREGVGPVHNFRSM